MERHGLEMVMELMRDVEIEANVKCGHVSSPARLELSLLDLRLAREFPNRIAAF